MPTSTQIPTSTLTLTMTPTVVPSPTFTSTPTIEPPSQLSNYFEDTRLTYYEGFDNDQLDQWDKRICQSVNNGELEFACADGYLSRKNSFYEGQGVLIDFKQPNQTGDYWWGMYFFSGKLVLDNWRSYGIAKSERGAYAILQKGNTSPYNFPAFTMKPDIWYRLALAIDEKGKVAILVWERDNPNTQPLKYINTLGTDWLDMEWFFRLQSDVVVNLDNYFEFTFSEFK